MNDDPSKTYTFPFSPGDWLHDIALNRCSLAAQGLWMKMICIMHQGEPYGHLQINGVPIETKELANMVGLGDKRGTERVTKCLRELDKMGVTSRTKCNVIYSRRMVRDQANRLINKQNGKKGGNPQLSNPVNPPLNPQVNAPVIPSLPLPLPLPSTSTPNTLVVSRETTPAKIPYEELVTAYNERRGGLPQARGLTDGRKRKIKARWIEHPDIEFWRSLFDRAGKSESMLKWASFDWLMKSQENYTKTIEGNYDNDRDRKSIPRAKSPPPPRERQLTPEEEEANRIAAEKFFGDYKKKKRGGGLTHVSEAMKTAGPVAVEEELPV